MLLTKKTAFREYISQELEAVASLSFPVRTYLLDLLCLYISSDELFESKKGKNNTYTLTELYKKSQASTKPQEKLYFFKKMGDFSLYLSGFFRSAVKKQLVSISYYEQIGQNAYAFVNSVCSSKTNVFKELSEGFPEFSQILSSIQKKTENQDTKYLLDFPKKQVSKLLN